MIPILGIPVLNRGDLLVRLIDSIDHPVQHLVIIDNSQGLDKSVRQAIDFIHELIQDKKIPIEMMSVEHPAINWGCAGSWNRIMTYPTDLYWFIVGSDIMFKPGSLDKIVAFINEHQDDHAMIYPGSYNAFAITPLAKELVGTFDENFYPAYLEDCDHNYRLKLVGAKLIDMPDIDIVHGEAPSWGSSTIYSDPELAKKNGITHTNNYEYYGRKWGGPNEGEVYKHPFNDPNWDVKKWVLEPKHRKKNSIWFT